MLLFKPCDDSRDGVQNISTVNSTDDAVSWVVNNKGLICKAIFDHYPTIMQQDLQEFVSDAYVIAIEAAITSSREGIIFQSVFWPTFRRHLKCAVRIDSSFISLDDLESEHGSNISPEAFLLREVQEKNLFFTFSSAANLLSSRELQLFMMINGFGDQGAFSLAEAARRLKVKYGTGYNMLNRIVLKLAKAGRCIGRDGRVFLYDAKKVRGGKKRSGRKKQAPCPVLVLTLTDNSGEKKESAFEFL